MTRAKFTHDLPPGMATPVGDHVEAMIRCAALQAAASIAVGAFTIARISQPEKFRQDIAGLIESVQGMAIEFEQHLRGGE